MFEIYFLKYHFNFFNLQFLPPKLCSFRLRHLEQIIHFWDVQENVYPLLALQHSQFSSTGMDIYRNARSRCARAGNYGSIKVLYTFFMFRIFSLFVQSFGSAVVCKSMVCIQVVEAAKLANAYHAEGNNMEVQSRRSKSASLVRPLNFTNKLTVKIYSSKSQIRV